jgi:hypothetical protein
MLQIKTSDIAVGSAMPFKSSMLVWENGANASDNNGLMSCITNSDNPTKVCLQGAVKTGSGPYDITSGWVIISGQLYPTIAITGLTLGSGQVIVGTITKSYPLVGTYDPVTFSDGTTHDVHELNTIVWSAGSAGTTSLDYDDLVFVNTPEALTGTIATAQWKDGSGGTTFNYYKIPFNKLVIDTTLEKQSAGSATIITLPSGYRPKVDRYFTTFGGSANPDTILTFKIDTSGNVTLHNSNGTLGLGTGDVYTIYCEIPLY